jgi:phage terminase Nu1 subunit (DNA packaging protein)
MTLTQTIVSEHLFLSQSAVSQLVARLALDLGKCSLDEVRRRYLEHLRAVASGRGASDMQAERLALTKARRLQVDLANEQELGNLVDAEVTRRAIVGAAVHIRSALERIPDKLAARIAAESDTEVIHAWIAEEIETTLTAMAADFRSMKFMQPSANGEPESAAPGEMGEGGEAEDAGA